MLSKRKYQRNQFRQVLVADDDFINRELLGNIISGSYEVLFAEDGQQAVDMINRNAETLSLVLLDLMMPVKNGFEVLKDMQDNEKTSHIPVIVLTSEKSAEVDSLRLGAADFISKPFNMPEVILARVQRAIELSEDTHILQVTERDPLTKLYNEEFFFEYANELDTRHPDWDMDAAVVNINHFRLLNELHGRDYGDEVLISVSDRIRELLEKVEGIAARADADNFYIYIRHQDDLEELLHEMGDAVRHDSEKTTVWLRMGVYGYQNEKIAVEKRFEDALSACNTLRNKFNKYVALYDRKAHEEELLAEELVNGMEKALRTGQFKVYYQAKYDIHGDLPRPCSAEALVRWAHPEKGMISPGLFIPLFEKNGLIQKLDRFIFREVAAQIRDWKDRLGFSVPVSVNVSRLDIFENDLGQFFSDLMDEYGLDEKDVLLEITESAYAEDSEQLVKTVNDLRARGFGIEMDDFGSGYSSLNMLVMLPLDYIKLDLRFVQGLNDNTRKEAMIKLVLGIAELLNVPIISEGVETEEQYLLLKELGCDICQGYYFAKPVPSDKFENILRGEKHA